MLTYRRAITCPTMSTIAKAENPAVIRDPLRERGADGAEKICPTTMPELLPTLKTTPRAVARLKWPAKLLLSQTTQRPVCPKSVRVSQVGVPRRFPEGSSTYRSVHSSPEYEDGSQPNVKCFACDVHGVADNESQASTEHEGTPKPDPVRAESNHEVRNGDLEHD
jgi:hypothetical protein